LFERGQSLIGSDRRAAPSPAGLSFTFARTARYHRLHANPPYLHCAGRLGLLPLVCLSLRAADAGTFHNLRDGVIVNVNGNNLQASYVGGDGNDLTVTVVP
jgi:hypothetical protein